MPTREQFLQDEQANKLRSVSLDIAKSVNKLLLLYTTLKKLGVEPSLYAGLDPSEYDDPLTMAGYVAGQWVTLLSENEKIFMVSFINLTHQALDAEGKKQRRNK